MGLFETIYVLHYTRSLFLEDNVETIFLSQNSAEQEAKKIKNKNQNAHNFWIEKKEICALGY